MTARNWLTIFRGGGKESTLPAPPLGTSGSLPVPVTARDVKKLVRQAVVTRPRLVVAFDATASRQPAWDAFSQPLQDDLLGALPGELDVALAVHGGSRVHTFTGFTSDASELRDLAAGVRCAAGTTRLLDILDRVVKLRRVGVVLYVGDCFEESHKRAMRLADELLLNGTRVIILHDTSGFGASGLPWQIPVMPGAAAFAALAERTGGAVLPFDPSSLDALGELLQAVAVLAVGDIELLKAKEATMPAATLLLEHLSNRKPIGRSQ